MTWSLRRPRAAVPLLAVSLLVGSRESRAEEPRKLPAAAPKAKTRAPIVLESTEIAGHAPDPVQALRDDFALLTELEARLRHLESVREEIAQSSHDPEGVRRFTRELASVRVAIGKLWKQMNAALTVALRSEQLAAESSPAPAPNPLALAPQTKN